jgi:DnaK suppressor protein
MIGLKRYSSITRGGCGSSCGRSTSKRDQFDNPQDMEDLSLIDLIEDTGLAVADIRRGELTQMDEALDRLEDGTYGLCADCGQEIDERRLKVRPFAVCCVSCQSEKEIR